MNPFDKIQGNEPIKHYLKRRVATHTLGNTLLFAGPESSAKIAFAKALAQLLLGSENHPDLHLYNPEGKIGMHSIDSMRQFTQEVYLAPYQASKKVFIINHAERMLVYSANALLKTLEEPAEDAVIILVSNAPDALLPTIRSRCCVIQFQASSASTPLEKTEKQEEVLGLLARGRMKNYKELSDAAKNLAKQPEKAKLTHENLTAAQMQAIEKEQEGIASIQMLAEAQFLFDLILGWYRDIELLRVNGNRKLLLNKSFEEAIEQSLQRGEYIPLEQVQKALSQARLSLERSTSMHICFETLFLQLNLI